MGEKPARQVGQEEESYGRDASNDQIMEGGKSYNAHVLGLMRGSTSRVEEPCLQPPINQG